MAEHNHEDIGRRATYTTLSGIFLAIFAMFSMRESHREQEFTFKPFDLALLALSTYRASHMVAYDKIAST